MHFSELHIDGFGVFQDCSVRDLPNGLVVFSGENESGKSTLMQFFRMVLFGPPRGTKGNNAYRPVRGGQYGGRLELVMGDGRNIVVERIDKKVRISDGGGTIEQEPSDVLLHPVDRQTYERVFAIGLEDLQGLNVLTEEGFRSRLLSTGKGLGDASVPETLMQLDRESEKLLTSRGYKQVIPVLKKKLTTVDQEIRKLRLQAAEFARLTSERDQLETERSKWKDDQGELIRRKERLRQLELSREPWIHLSTARREIAQYEFANSFPVNGRERLERLLENYERLVKERTAADEDLDKCEDGLKHLCVDTGILECRHEVEQLTAERQKLADAVTQLPNERNDVQRCRSVLVDRLRELGPDWDEQQLERVDTSVSVRHEVQQFEERLKNAKEAFDVARNEHTSAKQNLAQAREDLEDARSRLDAIPQPEISSAEELERRRRSIRSAQTLLVQVTSEQAALQSQQRAVEDQGKSLERLEQQSGDSVTTLPNWLGIAIGASGIAIAILMAILEYWPVAVGFAAVGVIGALAVAWMNRQLATQTQQSIAGRIAEIHQTLEPKREQIERLEQTVNGRRNALKSLLDGLGISLEAGDVGDRLSELENDVYQCAEQLREWASVKDEIQKLQRGERKAAQRVNEKSELFSEKKAAGKALQNEWRVWLEERAFDRSLRSLKDQPLRPQQFGDVLLAVEAARQARDALRAAESRLNRTIHYLEEVRDRIANVCSQAKIELTTDEPGIETVNLFTERLKHATADHQLQQNLEGERDRARKVLIRRSKEIETNQEAKQKLFLECDADDERGFRERASAHASWEEIRGKIDAGELQLRAIAGGDDLVDELVTELEMLGPLDVATEKTECERQLKEIEKRVSDDQERMVNIDRDLEQMAVDTKLSNNLQIKENLEESLDRATKRWAALAVCRSLLEKAREVYERERQPSVIQTADRFLKVMVNDRYRMIAALGEETVQVEADNKERKDQSFWSSGLADQVYLATRLGLACEFGKHAEPLPLIFDDVLVRFDATRRKAAARALLEVAAQQQVLLFSCHPEVVAAVQSEWDALEAPQVPLACFTLADGQIRPMNGESPSQASLF